ncbi:MAG: DNA polymerase III subunit alpha, partial [Pseudomonadota bacterium]
VHLCVHSEYSLLDGMVRIKPLAAAVSDGQMAAVANTDRSNLFSMVKFYRAATAAGVKPIIGVDALVRNTEDVNKPHRLLLLVRNRDGYLNLSRLVSRSYREGQHLGMAMMDREWFSGSSDGLIAIAPSHESDIGQALLANRVDIAAANAAEWRTHFPGACFLGVSRTGRVNEEDALHLLVDFAQQQQLPLVAHNDVRFLNKEDFEAHEVRVCIHDGRTLDDPRRQKLYTDQQYLRSEEEMCALFVDLPAALQNSVEIAKCCNLELTLGENVLPEFPVPQGMTTGTFFAQESRKGLAERLQGILDQDAEEYQQRLQAYQQRLDFELDVISQMGFPGYFLIVADFIQWAKDNAIPVGPGRGSGAGSLVAYSLKITDLDPLEHDLLFERFLNPERVSMPDFDIDFCMEGRDRVIDYVAQTYGRDSVSQIITYGSMAAKAVVRDVGRVMGHPYGFVDRIAKAVPFEIGMTLTKALEESTELKELYEGDEEVAALIKMALKLEGLARNAGKHAGGVVISPTVLTDFTPLYCEADGANLVTQFDKNDVEAVGLVKFDFLGLRTLTIIDWALHTINRRRQQQGEPAVDINAIPMDDKQAFQLLQTGETTAVFQLESHGMQELIRKLKPDSFDDMTALVALYRPGPLQSGMVDDFVLRKHGAEVVYPHPDLEPILEPTYGIILYQEQVMQIAQVLAGYTLGGADMLRRAMGKKKAEEMAKQRDIFMEGALKRDVEEETAEYIFDLMEKFAGYGFNKSHSAAYALVSYQTLWLKCHYPAEFMAAVLSSDMDNTDKVVTFIEECRSMGLEVLPPDVNRSDYMFSVSDEGAVIYGLGAVKGVGESALDEIVKARGDGKTSKPYHDLFDFCQRLDLRKVNRRVMDALIRAGAMDQLGKNRASLIAQIPMALKMAEQRQADAASGQNDLFGMSEAQSRQTIDPKLIPLRDDWQDEQRLQGEKETLGLYLTGHPIDRYESDLASLGVTRLDSLSLPQNGSRKPQRVRIAGLVMMINRRESRSGMMANVLLDDRTARIETTFFSETLEAHQEILAVDSVLMIEGDLVHDGYRDALNVRAVRAVAVEEARLLHASRLTLDIDAHNLNGHPLEQVISDLGALLKPYQGGECQVLLDYNGEHYKGRLKLGDDWRVAPRDALLHRLRQFLGEKSIQVGYHPVSRG